MSDEILQWLSGDDGFAVHSGLVIAFILGGFGIPIPEDIPLLLAGLAASKKIVTFPSVFLTCYLGVLLADQIVYCIGFFFGQRLLDAGTRSRFLPSVTEQKVNEIRDGLRKKRLLYIFVGRHLFPIRSATFLTAGALRIPYLEFFVSDAIAALVSVLLMVSLGYLLGETLTPEIINEKTQQLHLYIFAIVAIVALLFIGHMLAKRIFSKTESEPEASLNVVPIIQKTADDVQSNKAQEQKN